MKNSIIKLSIAAIIGATSSLLFTFFIPENNISDEISISNIKEKTEEKNDFSIIKTSSNIDLSRTDFTIAAEKTINTVVHIKSEYNNTYSSDPLMDFFWGPQGSRGVRPQIATGSGVIISADGYIVTNNHVIDNADKISITMNDGSEIQAELIGTDPGTDIALLKINDNELEYSEFGNSDDVKVGQWALAVGNPFNLTSTVTAGIISAKARSINILKGDRNNNIFPLESFLQTDAAVNPGNSGGALVSSDGLLIGINTAIASKTGSYSGYSFAVPSNLVLKVVNDIKNYGVVQRAFIGVVIQDITQEIADKLNLPNTKGIYVNGLSENGAALDAGIKVGDVIIKVANKEVNNVPELQEQIGNFKPGDKIDVIIRQGNNTNLISVTLKNQNGNTNIINKKVLDEKQRIYGTTFINIDKAEKIKFNISNGVKVYSIGNGKFKDAGLSSGFIITKVNNKSIQSVKQLINILNSTKGGVLFEGVQINGVPGYFGFGL